MIPSPTDKTRNVIPRWRRFSVAAALGQLSFAGKSDKGNLTQLHNPPIKTTAYERNLAAWHESQSLEAASELVMSALVTGRRDGFEEAAELIAQHRSAMPAIHQIVAAARLRGGVANSPDIPLVRHQRAFTYAEPRNAIGWIDLALAHFSNGECARAKKAVEVALALAPENRHVLRSAACFFVNTNNSDRANQLINRSDRVAADPWIASAEIATATAAGRPSKLAKRAKDALSKHEFHPRDASELASAVATLELRNGNHKHSKKLFRASLDEPNENTVAQVQWAVEHCKIHVPVMANHLRQPLAFESVARDAYIRNDWVSCAKSLESWMRDQPFLVQPALIGSFVASELLGDAEWGVRFSEFGLRSHPQHVMMHNNAAVIFARAKRLDRAEAALARAISLSSKANKQEQIFLRATAGLLEFRRGNALLGEVLYKQAIAEAEEANLKQLGDRALVYFIQEAVWTDPRLSTKALHLFARLDTPDRPASFRKELGCIVQRLSMLAQTNPTQSETKLVRSLDAVGTTEFRGEDPISVVHLNLLVHR